MTQAHRARQYAATHQRIYDTAMALFAECGYEEVAIGQIATAAGVSVPTFYAHYASKDELIMALPERAEVAALLAAAPADRPLAERLRLILGGFLAGMAAERRADTLARWRIIASTPRLRYRAAGYERATAQMLLDELGVAEDGDPAVVVVTAHFSAYTQALLRWGASGGTLPLEEVAAEAMAVLRGM
ncbi:transcriptional regulator, TetR family [Geodermatophilus pulveris]|uniref:Transcriptional regulator, TetR family n=1 Tax=Geodermatophilus pulveris TaxID=1564159 RepID=A0A239FJV8_9ACTN|nr:TetR/AcrR family transcriptional regulator [Geodermatophilus pulveris]SNS57041.1 transcriptional regulator, TetR family [Geodermatophilus pulveris]